MTYLTLLRAWGVSVLDPRGGFQLPLLKVIIIEEGNGLGVGMGVYLRYLVVKLRGGGGVQKKSRFLFL